MENKKLKLSEPNGMSCDSNVILIKISSDKQDIKESKSMELKPENLNYSSLRLAIQDLYPSLPNDFSIQAPRLGILH